MGDKRTTMLSQVFRSGAARVPVRTAARALSTFEERGYALEDQYFKKREAEMLRKLKKHSVEDGDKPIVPDYFVRRSTVKVASLEQAADIDDIMIDEIVPLSKAQDGFVGFERHVCGKHLDYVLMTKWATPESLHGTGAGSPYMEMVLQKVEHIIDTGSIETQNFMGDTDRFA